MISREMGKMQRRKKKTLKVLNLLSDEVFSDKLNSLEKKILVNCLRNIENQVEELF